MKKVLILVIGCNMDPWNKMVETSENTWDSIHVEGCETIFYFGEPVKENTHNKIYFPIRECYQTMGEKMLRAFEWILSNKEFDYVARVNGSCYVDKKVLIDHVQGLRIHNIFQGVEVSSDQYNEPWMWGGGQFLISKDVIQKIVDNQQHWNHTVMEDVALSFMANKLEIPYSKGSLCSINKTDNGWLHLMYGEGESFESPEIKGAKGQYFYRCKQDLKREEDKFVMESLFKNLNP